MSSFEVVHAEAPGKWPEIWSELGIDLEHLRNRYGPCPEGLSTGLDVERKPLVRLSRRF